jgi:hypothetical protein
MQILKRAPNAQNRVLDQVSNQPLPKIYSSRKDRMCRNTTLVSIIIVEYDSEEILDDNGIKSKMEKIWLSS